MKNSTIVGIGGVALAGVGAYLYFKGKKNSVVSGVPSVTPQTNDTKVLEDLGIKVTPTPTTPTPYAKPNEGVPLVTTENMQKALLALKIDTTIKVDELASPNYIQASKLAKYINLLRVNSNSDDFKLLEFELKPILPVRKCRSVAPKNSGCYSYESVDDYVAKILPMINNLGYKLLTNGSIEKM